MYEYRIKTGTPAKLGVTRNGKDINFVVVVRDRKECSLILYRKGSEEIAAEFPFTEEMRFGDLCAMEVGNLPIKEYEYNYRIDGEIVQDPYAARLAGRETWGVRIENPHALRGALPSDRFDWQGDRPLMLPYEECVLYMTHVRGFTKDASSGARRPGTFAGVREKIP